MFDAASINQPADQTLGLRTPKHFFGSQKIGPCTKEWGRAIDLGWD